MNTGCCRDGWLWPISGWMDRKEIHWLGLSVMQSTMHHPGYSLAPRPSIISQWLTADMGTRSTYQNFTYCMQPRSQTTNLCGLGTRLIIIISSLDTCKHGSVDEGWDTFTGAVYCLCTDGCASAGVSIRGERSVSITERVTQQLPWFTCASVITQGSRLMDLDIAGSGSIYPCMDGSIPLSAMSSWGEGEPGKWCTYHVVPT